MRLFRIASCVFVVSLGVLCPGAGAQGPGLQTPAGGGTGATGGSVGTNPGLPSRTPTQPNNNPMDDPGLLMQRPIFISGKVMTDDGSPLPSNIAVQKLCGGSSPQTMGYTDAKGHFSFQWDQPNAGFADASESGFGGAPGIAGARGSSSRNSGSMNQGMSRSGDRIQNCEVQVNVAGYRANSLQLFNHSSLDNPEIGTIVLHRMGNVEGTSVSATSFGATKDAKKAFDRGLQALLKNKPEDAAKEFDKATSLYPKYADAWYNLGKARAKLNQNEPARDALTKALEADGKLVGPWFELGMMAAGEKKWEDAAKYLDKTVHLDPVDFPQAWYVHAVAEYNLGNLEAAEKSAREARKLDARHANPRTEYLLGIVLTESRDYPAAVEAFQSFLKLMPNAPEAPQAQAQLAELNKFLGGKGPGQQ